MLVRGHLLRYQGLPRARDTIKDESPLMGNLRWNSQTGIMLLMPDGEVTEPIVQLFKSRIRKVERRGIVIVGIEDIWRRKRKDSYPQAFWCWPVEAEPPIERDPLDFEDEVAALR